jgi:Holliday junction DNA helicase RuvA
MDVSGVGYKIFVTREVLDKVAHLGDQRASLWTYLAVRENSLDLYGFLNQEGLQFFELLITISGIGPKTAQGILNVAGIATLRGGIASGDPTRLSKISGISKKNAEKIVLELKDRFEGEESQTDDQYQNESDALEALKGLGYSEKQARDAIKKLDKKIETTSEKVKHALKLLAK